MQHSQSIIRVRGPLLQEGNFMAQFPGATVRSLSVKQPYASLILPPHKKAETRTWYTSFRGWVLIISSKNKYSHNEIFDISGAHNTRRIEFLIRNERPLIAGYAIGLAYLSQIRPMLKEDESATFVRHFENLFVWEWDKVYKIEPFECKGAQRFGKLSLEQLNKIHIIK